MDQDIRPSPIAGQWYTADGTALASELDGYINQAVLPKIPGEVVAVIAPHAGYRYSGSVAGYAFAAIRHNKPEVIAILSPMHQPYRQSFLTSGHQYYSTPLGTIRVDNALVSRLTDSLWNDHQLDLHPVRNDGEHSLEIELPFLQRIYTHPFTLLPVMVRDYALESCEKLGATLFQVLQEKNAMVVISTDLSHFYQEHTANMLDANIMESMMKLDTCGVYQSEVDGTGFACGAGAVIAGLQYARFAGATKGVLLKYGTSGNVTHDHGSVVGYGAITLVKET